jgi:DNA polymerase III epsilon subunit-like protein
MYVSIDIETGGLDIDMDILQIAAVKWDSDEVMDCSFIDIIIKLPFYLMEPFAANMNRELLRILAENEDERIVDGYEEAWARLSLWLDGKYFAMGKNVSMFDLPFLENKGFPCVDYFRHKVLDIGNLYATRKGIPSLSQILKREPVDIPGKLHDALYDARACVALGARRLSA